MRPAAARRPKSKAAAGSSCFPACIRDRRAWRHRASAPRRTSSADSRAASRTRSAASAAPDRTPRSRRPTSGRRWRCRGHRRRTASPRKRSTSSSRKPMRPWPAVCAMIIGLECTCIVALRHSGGAGRIEPIGDFVGAGSAPAPSLRSRRPSSVSSRGTEAGPPPTTTICLEVWQVGRGFLHDRQQRGRDEDRLGARILEQVAILVDRQPRVDQNRNNAGPDRAPEQDRESRPCRAGRARCGFPARCPCAPASGRCGRRHRAARHRSGCATDR